MTGYLLKKRTRYLMFVPQFQVPMDWNFKTMTFRDDESASETETGFPAQRGRGHDETRR